MSRDSGVRDQVIGHATAYRRQLAEIREDKTLSPLGKRQKIEALYGTTKPVVDQLREQLHRGEYTTRQQLERRLFGLPQGASPSDAISFRDALDRVSAVKNPHELGELMERAASTGDEMLLRAGAQKAYQQSRNPMASDDWSGLVDEYAAQNPAAGRDLQALAESASPRSRTAEFSERLHMEVARPPELDKSEAHFDDAAPVRPAADRTEGLIR